MGEHPRRFDGIQAGHAANAGKLLRQYVQVVEGQPEAYEATLTICVLHSMLTQCTELLKTARRLADLREPITDCANSLGLTTEHITMYTFPEPLTGDRFLTHLRDALSHPAPDEEFFFRPTGFTTTGDPSGVIRGYVFTNSPWVKDDERFAYGESLPCLTERAARGVIKSFCKGSRKDFPLDVLALADGRFDVGYAGQPYVPTLVAEIPLDVLMGLALALSDLLSRHRELTA